MSVGMHFTCHRPSHLFLDERAPSPSPSGGRRYFVGVPPAYRVNGCRHSDGLQPLHRRHPGGKKASKCLANRTNFVRNSERASPTCSRNARLRGRGPSNGRDNPASGLPPPVAALAARNSVMSFISVESALGIGIGFAYRQSRACKLVRHRARCALVLSGPLRASANRESRSSNPTFFSSWGSRAPDCGR